MDWDEDEPIAIPIDGVLDLHTFRPGEVKALLADYLEACQEAGILEVRVIHGKGRGELRRLVQATLARLPLVESYRLAEGEQGGWGATVVTLNKSKPLAI
ncbi:MAG: Smr/MutS family protein [Desulfarculus sp.]|nr:Smr/MutS family protein [Desulfarculus sp.]